MTRIPKILFFDSGLGGLSVFREVYKLNPQCAFYYLFDHECFPYGNKSENFLKDRVSLLLKKAIALLQPDMLVVACNTASTIVLPRLREEFDLPIVGVVPAIKPAAKLSSKKIIGLLATPGTVSRSYTDFLINEFAYDCKVIRLGSEELVRLAENYMLESDDNPNDILATTCKFSSDLILKLSNILQPFTSLPHQDQPDVVVLGCTHFPLLRSQIHYCLGSDVALVDSGAAIAHRVQQLLLLLNLERMRKEVQDTMHSAQETLQSAQAELEQGLSILPSISASVVDSTNLYYEGSAAPYIKLEADFKAAKDQSDLMDILPQANSSLAITSDSHVAGSKEAQALHSLKTNQNRIVNPEGAGPKVMMFTGHLNDKDQEMLEQVSNKFSFPLSIGLDLLINALSEE